MESRPVNKSRIPQAGLVEMNSAKTNSRSGLKAPGFATSGIKASTIPSTFHGHFYAHNLSLTDIAEAAAVTNTNPQPSSSTSRIPNGATRTHGRTNSFSSSVSSRTMQSRATTSSSFSQTVGNGSRTAGSRPQTSMAQRKYGASSIARPQTSLDTHEEEASPNSVLGKRKGMQNPSRSLQVTPGSCDKHMNCTMSWTPSPSSSRTPDGLPTRRRDPSLTTLLSKLSLSEPMEPPNGQEKRIRKVPSRSTITKTPLRQSKSSSLISHPPSRYKLKPSPQKAPPALVPYLTKCSHSKAWDHDTRMQDFEDMASVFFNKMNQAGQNSDVMKDAVNLYKSRGNPLDLYILGDNR